MIRFSDAHCHLQFAVIAELNEALFAGTWFEPGLLLVNSTCPKDWADVSALAEKYDPIRPAYGVHPWQVKQVKGDSWIQDLEKALTQTPTASIGEVGLDAWVADHDMDLQKRVLLPQLELARHFNRCVSFHCLRCWDEFYVLLKKIRLPERGFILHAFAGPDNLIPGFLRMGAYFSFNAALAHPRKQKHWTHFATLPSDRILVETDAPDMLPPVELRPAQSGRSDVSFNHPGNLPAAYDFLAKLRACPVAELSEAVEQNLRVLTNPL